MSGPAQIYLDYLNREGYRPTVDSDGDVIFKKEGMGYFIPIDTSDPQFFAVICPGFWSIDDGNELARVHLAANYATLTTKVAKINVRSDGKNTVGSVELFLERPEQFTGIFTRAMHALEVAINDFRKEMNKH